jgi:hypothetical protein
MNGLLDFLKTPEGQGLLAAGLGAAASAGRGRGLLGNIGQGGLMGLQAYGGAQERQQLEAVRNSEIDQRKAALAKQQQIQAMVSGLFQGAPAQPGQLGSGSYGIVEPAPGAPAAPSRGGLAGASIEQIAALQAIGGPDLLNSYKLAREGFERKPGSFYEGVNGGREYIPDPSKGIGFQGGRVAVLPGAAESQAALTAATEGAKAQAAAGYDLTKVVGPDGAERYVTRSQAVQAAGGGSAPRPMQRQPSAGAADADRFAILTQELAKAEQTGNQRDAAALRNEIARLSPEARTAASPSGLAVQGPYQASPTTAQAADAAGAKVKAEADARAQAEREAGAAKKATTAKDMLGMVSQARELLKQGPTSSGVGAAVDAGLGLVGKSTQGADVAARLDTISGWMVNNVPRMEGPQSNFDVQNYRTMAGIVGDRSKPISQRMAALDTLETLQNKYAHLNASEAPKSGGATGSWDDKPAPPKPMKGMVRGGYRFKGGDPADPASWEKT